MHRPDFQTQILIGICATVWVVCAIAPLDLEAWMLEQFASACGLIFLAWSIKRKIRFSLGAKASIAVLFIAHTIGTHFTYSLTPYDATFAALSGISINDLFGFERNHYDRFVHLLYGLCLAEPTTHLLRQLFSLSRPACRMLSFHIIISTSALYELVEWIAALLFGGDLGAMYLGTQGDVWDAQIDIALAGLGFVMVYIADAVIQKSRTLINTTSRLLNNR